jgi:hypothetical protein
MATSEQPNERTFSESDPVLSKPTTDQQLANDEEFIDGGTIVLSRQTVSWKERHESETAKVLAFTLVGILAGSLLIHYVAVTVLMLCGQKTLLTF